ncbi:hypothetical protein [Limnofasciculus baicalensis]|uniref:Uncharacterized protein n=1 Tax=Limnofasciculus baicalensis BBK-W-15 TaxID=2699891 RepID=A0AAE3GUX2_9CYAN|nr:hypothetical protein [Limnofasciculus baicalensis]MCP2730431.1 hypothetical protein [Limnofasciculus baicalensis BBK-W-15]
MVWRLIQTTELDVQDIEAALAEIAELDGDSVAEQIATCLAETDSDVIDAS